MRKEQVSGGKERIEKSYELNDDIDSNSKNFQDGRPTSNGLINLQQAMLCWILKVI